MKKKIIGLLFPSLLAVGLFANMRGANAKQADALSYETEISVGPGFFYDLDPTAGQYADAGATFWGEGYAFNSMGTFFRGETAEGWKGTLTSRKWTQHTQYVYFTWSGQNNSDAVNIRFYYDGCSGPIVIKNTAFVGNPMMLWYAKIPDEDYAKFTESGVQMSLELYDDADSDYGFHNFGYLHVNQTEEQVSNAMRYYLNHLKAPINDWEVEKHKEILNHYYYNGHLRNVFLRTVDSVDEDFENGNDFVNHWYLDYNYDNALDTNRHIDNVIGTDEYRLGSNMPFNKTGNGYFKGWYEGGDINQGYIDSDRPIYRFMSRPFVLKDTGLISLKMAGRAASLHVIDADTREDLAWADLRSFNDEGSQEIQALSGFNTVTMVRHYINLEEYVGKTIQLALADVYDSGWAASYFDELITDYKEYPVLDFEIVKQENETATSYKVYRDKYICSTPILVDPNGLKHPDGKANLEHEDNSPMYEAYRFLNEFFYLVDEDDNKYDLVKSYRLLSEEAKELVDKASDYHYEE